MSSAFGLGPGLKVHDELLRISLSQRQAKQKLIDGVSERLSLAASQRSPVFCFWLLVLIEPSNLHLFASGILLLVSSAASNCLLEKSAWRAALGGALVLACGINAWVDGRERRLRKSEVARRMQAWLRRVSHDYNIFRSNAPQDVASTFTVMRDGVWVRMHRNLLVAGDLLRLRAGERAPGRCVQPPHFAAVFGTKPLELALGEQFVPPPMPRMARGTAGAEALLCTFLLEEDIAAAQVEKALLPRDRGMLSPLEQEVRVTRELLLLLALLVGVQAVLVQLVGWSLRRFQPPPVGVSWTEVAGFWLNDVLLPHLITLWLPLFPLALPPFLAIAHAFGSAYLIACLVGMPQRNRQSGRGTTSRTDHSSGGGGQQAAGRGGGSFSYSASALARGISSSWVSDMLHSGHYRRFYDVPSSVVETRPETISKRGPDMLLSDGAPHHVPGSRFIRHAGDWLSTSQWSHLLKLSWQVLRGKAHISELHASRLVSTVGSVTVLACPDKEGVLSDSSPSVKQLHFFRPDSLGSSKLTTLDLSKHPDYRSLIRFDQPDWRNQLSSLKPIGLNCVVNSLCRHNDGGVLLTQQLRAALLREPEHAHAPAAAPTAAMTRGPVTDGVCCPCFSGGSGVDGSCGGGFCASPFGSGVAGRSACCRPVVQASAPAQAGRQEPPPVPKLALASASASAAAAAARAGPDGSASCALAGDKPPHPCFCMLAREIGFGDDVLKRFVRRAEIHVVCHGSDSAATDAPGGVPERQLSDGQLGLLMAVVVDDEEGKQQLFSRGDLSLILPRCSSLWDGEAVRALTASERRQLLSANASITGKRCLHSVAFAYTPVPPELSSLFSSRDSVITVFLDEPPPAYESHQPGTEFEQVHAMGATSCAAAPASAALDTGGLCQRALGSSFRVTLDEHGSEANSRQRSPKLDLGAVDDAVCRRSDSTPCVPPLQLSSSLGVPACSASVPGPSESCDGCGRCCCAGSGGGSSSDCGGGDSGRSNPSALGGPGSRSDTALDMTHRCSRPASPKIGPSCLSGSPALRRGSCGSSRDGAVSTPAQRCGGGGGYSSAAASAQNTPRRADEMPELITLRRQAALRRLLRGQVFLGLAGSLDRARVEAPDMVEDLFNAGIRFVHMSASDERRTKAFGYELGLETDWNSCIDLAEPEIQTPSSKFAESGSVGRPRSPLAGQSAGGFLKLPRGISAVRPHLQHVDNVPLLVSMFSGVTPPAAREMVKVYQENAELVCVIGSRDKPQNADTFAQANLAVALAPLQPWRCLWIGLEQGAGAAESQRERFASSVSSVPALLDTTHCATVLPAYHDLEQLTEWLLQGRSLLANMRQALSFGLFCSLLYLALLIAADWLWLPAPFSPAQLMYLLLGPTPLLSFSLLVSPIDARNKKEMVPKNEPPSRVGAIRFGCYLLLRATPGIVCLTVLYASFLYSFQARMLVPATSSPPMPPPPSSPGVAVGGSSACWPPSSLRLDHAPADAVVFAARVLLQCWTVLLLIGHSSSFAHGTLGSSKFRPSENSVWIGACAFVVCLQSTLAIFHLGPAQVLLVLSDVPWYTYLLGFAMLMLARMVDMLVKRHQRRLFERTNRRMYLEFTTKLGMHSPILPGHRTPTSYLDEQHLSFANMQSHV